MSTTSSLHLGTFLASLPPDLSSSATGLYRRLAHVQSSLLPDLVKAGQTTDGAFNVGEAEEEIQNALNESQERCEELLLAEEEYESTTERNVVRNAAQAAQKDLHDLTERARQTLLSVRQAVREQAQSAPSSGMAARAALGLDTGGSYRPRYAAASTE